MAIIKKLLRLINFKTKFSIQALSGMLRFSFILFFCFQTISAQIIQPDTRYEHQITYLDSSGHAISTGRLDIIGTDLVCNGGQDHIYYRLYYSKEDSASFVNNPRLLKSYNYWVHWRPVKGEGIIQNDKLYWWHPLRINQYVFTYYAPFPRLKFPLEISKEWSSRMGTNEFPYARVYSEYEVTARYDYWLPLANCTIQVWEVNATSCSHEGDYGLQMIFNEEFGFVELNYTAYNGDQVCILLNDIRKDIGDNEWALLRSWDIEDFEPEPRKKPDIE